MSQTVHIINPGQGNISSVQHAFEFLGAKTVLVSESSQLQDAERLILPGIGHFDTAMQKLRKLKLDEEIIQYAASGKPLLGICLGMQILARHSEEGTEKGLGILSGSVIKMEAKDSFRFKIPHNGWNTLAAIKECELLSGITAEDEFFFLHRYRWSSDAQEVFASAEYETLFPAVVGRNKTWGVQFHPEKSHESGLKLLSNFLRL